MAQLCKVKRCKEPKLQLWKLNEQKNQEKPPGHGNTAVLGRVGPLLSLPSRLFDILRNACYLLIVS
jgi:hypothetical protein